MHFKSDWIMKLFRMKKTTRPEPPAKMAFGKGAAVICKRGGEKSRLINLRLAFELQRAAIGRQFQIQAIAFKKK